MNFLVNAVRPFNVAATLSEARAVWSQFRKELSVADPDADCSEETLVARLAGRLGIALLVSEVVGTYMFSPGLAVAGQYLPGGSWWLGLLGGIAGDYFPAVISYGIAALLLSWRYYREGGWFRLGRFAREVGFVYYCAGTAALVLYASDAAACWGVVKLLELISPEVAHNIPVVTWFAIGNGIFEVLYLAAAAGFIPKAAALMAKEYRGYLVRKSQAEADAPKQTKLHLPGAVQKRK